MPNWLKMKKKEYYFKISCLGFFIFCLTQLPLYGQNEENVLFAGKTEVDVFIDGYLNEDFYNELFFYSDFDQYFPFDTSKSVTKTEVVIFYDDKNLYVAAKIYDKDPGKHVSMSMRRDFPTNNVDAFNVILDPFNDQTIGFLFGVNPFNVQREGLISNGGGLPEDVDFSWDNIWYSATSVHTDHWQVEISIPFKTLRYRENIMDWGVNFFTSDTYRNELSVWNRVPRQFELINLAFTGRLTFEGQLGTPGKNISLIPFALASDTNDNLAQKTRKNFSVGGDIKVALSSSTNLDLTINPDFSQVEVDQQQTNLDRFELFFPERRQFFLENADLFSNFGLNNARPFFSRRIGVTIDSATGQNVQEKIIGGARLTGKFGKNWRLGILNMQSASDDLLSLPSLNYSVFSLQKKTFHRSNINFFYVGRHQFNFLESDQLNSREGQNLAGVDYNLASRDGKWSGKFYWHQSMKEGGSTGYSHGSTLTYNTLKFFATWTHQLIDNDFEAVVGFVPRKDFFRINPIFGFNFFPRSKIVNRHQILFSNNWIWNQTWGLTDYNLSSSWIVTFQNTSIFNFSILNNYVKLFFPFNPTGRTDQQFQPGDEFVQTGFLTSYQSDLRKPFFFNIQLINGGFFNGNLSQVSGNLNFRYKQFGSLGLNYNFNKITLTEGFSGSDLILFGPRIDLTVTNYLFWTTFIQYNNQFDNLNINSRIQWRFRPASDAFLVYTNNYFPESLMSKNRSLVFKFIYWFNI